MQCYCRRGMPLHCLLVVLAALASADPPPGVPIAAQDGVAEYVEPQLGIEQESRRQTDANLWADLVVPERQYNYWESKKEVTDTGKAEAPQAADYEKFVPEINPVLPKEKKWIPCDHDCMEDEYCWEGHCTYRPWKYHERTKYQCYPDPGQPGLSLEEKMRCRADVRRYDKDICVKTKYCVYLSDSPMWYKPFIDKWRPPPPQPGGLFDKYIADAEDFARSSVATRAMTGAEPLTRSQKRANAEDKYLGGTNTLPYGARTKDNWRNWAGEEDYAPLQPTLHMEIKDPPVRDGPYPTNTTGPRFLANSTDLYWYMKNSIEKKAVADDKADKIAEDKKAAEEAAAEAKAEPPGPAPGPASSPAPGPAPGPAPAQIASPAFLEIRQIQEHPYI